jgi:peptide chain release factor 2
LNRFEAQASAPDFWNEQEAAQKLLQVAAASKRRSSARNISNLRLPTLKCSLSLRTKTNVDQELQSYSKRARTRIEPGRNGNAAAGDNDRRNAICTIHPGAGGTESQDWAEMLLRMYLKWAEQRGFKAEVLEYQPGEEAGLKSVTFRVEGEYAYGLLAAEAGVHRLVRISPFDQAARRHTSFASLFVYPEIDEDIEVEINDKDFARRYLSRHRRRWTAHQHHGFRQFALPTSPRHRRILSNQRSQHQNRAVAMQVLRSRLYELELERRKPKQPNSKPTRPTSHSGRKSEVMYSRPISS